MQTVMNTKVIPSDGQTHLDFANWPRRSAFDFFRAFDIPSFNVCTKIDVTLSQQHWAGLIWQRRRCR
jgi:chloramphenicol O-acetyltransferase